MYFYLIIGGLLLAVVVFMVFKDTFANRPARPKSDASTGYKPTVRAAATGDDFQITHKGVGSQTTEAAYMDAGLYRITYQLERASRAKIDLVSADGGLRKAVVDKVGYGSSTFNVQVGKYYVFRVETTQQADTWTFIVKRY